MKRKFLIAVILTLAVLSSLVSCGRSDYFDTKASGDMSDSEFYLAENTSNSGSENSASVAQNRKIIKNILLSVETTEYDKLIANLEKQISDLGGYIEQSSMYGNKASDDYRSSEIKARIPSDKAEPFSEFVTQNGNLVEKSVTTEDVTLKYVDTESRLSAKQSEKTALEALLEKAQNVDEIISVRERLTEVIGEIEAYTAELKTYDNLVDYTTVTVSVSEVERTTVTEKQGTWQKIGTNIKNSAENVWNGAVALFVFVLGSLPYLAVLALIATVTALICIRSRRKKKAAAENKKANAENKID